MQLLGESDAEVQAAAELLLETAWDCRYEVAVDAYYEVQRMLHVDT